MKDWKLSSSELPYLTGSSMSSSILAPSSSAETIHLQTPRSLIDKFEQISRRAASRVAVVCGEQQVSYTDLNRTGNELARQLLALEIPEKSIIAIYVDRSVGMIAAMLGVLKAGHAYLPIDPTYPVGRVIQTLEDARPAVVITTQALAAGLPPTSVALLLLDPPSASPSSKPDDLDNLPSKTSADDLAYVMYTSGSTGKPKGVLVTHQNVMRLISETEPWFHFDQNDVWTMFHSFAFDFSVWEIWGPLLTGGKLIIVPFAVSRSPEDFYTLLSHQQVTVLNQTPSAFSLLNQIEETGNVQPLALRLVIFGGEALQYRSLRAWFQRHGDQKPQLVNMYGITETTVHVTYRIVTEADANGEQDSLIGIPIPDLQIHLLDPDGNPVKVGEVGEICVGGGGVARGYLNRPELSAERFVPDPFGPPGALLYRSGDLARRRPDGELVYLGRGDGQVKINGFRVELGEIESAISDFPSVQQVSVIAHTDSAGRQRLAAYFVAAGDTPIPTHSMSEFLSRRLPAQMMPAFYMQIDKMPLTGNGKIDRAALPQPTAGSLKSEWSAGSPMQQRVAAIWCKVLGTRNVTMDDNFFDIGGSSVLLVSVRAALQEQLARSIPVTWMFEYTTIRSLAERLTNTDTAAAGANASTDSAQIGAAQDQARKQRDAFARLRAARGAAR